MQNSLSCVMCVYQSIPNAQISLETFLLRCLVKSNCFTFLINISKNNTPITNAYDKR